MITGLVRGTAAGANATPTKGWVAGHMQTGLGHSGDFEIKLWDYREPFEYGKKAFGGTEFIVIYGGVLRFELEWKNADGVVETEELVLRSETHDFVILPPDVIKRVIVAEAPAFGVTVRWPSAPAVNRVVT